MELQIDSIKTLDLAASWESMDRLEEEMALQPGAIFSVPVKHRFTDHLYSRQVYLPKDLLLTSEIHLTEHQYVVIMGVIAVWTPDTNSWIRLDAPEHGITLPGTRRVLYALEDTVWTTFHRLTDEENEHRNVEKIMERLLDQPHRAKFHSPQLPYWEEVISATSP
jgi:hypothetical protein